MNDKEHKHAIELAETVALRFGIEPVPGQEIQSVLYYLRQLPTNDDGVYLGLVGHKPGELMQEQEFGQFFYSDGKNLLVEVSDAEVKSEFLLDKKSGST